MIQLNTDEIINILYEALGNNLSILYLKISFFIILIISFLVTLKFEKSNSKKEMKKFYIVITIFIFILISVNNIFMHFAIKNSIKNISFEIKTDNIIRIKKSLLFDDNYYVYLANNGKILIDLSQNKVKHYSKGDSLNVSTIDGILGKKYTVNKIISSKDYYYNE